MYRFFSLSLYDPTTRYLVRFYYYFASVNGRLYITVTHITKHLLGIRCSIASLSVLSYWGIYLTIFSKLHFVQTLFLQFLIQKFAYLSCALLIVFNVHDTDWNSCCSAAYTATTPTTTRKTTKQHEVFHFSNCKLC
jgi:hypothetical protein